MTDNYKEHQFHTEYDKKCSECFKEEVKCEIKKCGRGLERLIKYGRNICENCQEKLL